jgi:hypothetical protein
VKDLKLALPALWVFLMFNYLYCDVISLFDSSVLKDVLAGHGSGGSSLEITPEFLLAASVLMEIPIAMTLLSRLLRSGPTAGQTSLPRRSWRLSSSVRS